MIAVMARTASRFSPDTPPSQTHSVSAGRPASETPPMRSNRAASLPSAISALPRSVVSKFSNVRCSFSSAIVPAVMAGVTRRIANSWIKDDVQKNRSPSPATRVTGTVLPEKGVSDGQGPASEGAAPLVAEGGDAVRGSVEDRDGSQDSTQVSTREVAQ